MELIVNSDVLYTPWNIPSNLLRLQQNNQGVQTDISQHEVLDVCIYAGLSENVSFESRDCRQDRRVTCKAVNMTACLFYITAVLSSHSDTVLPEAFVLLPERFFFLPFTRP